jgi:hypothetical protein
MGQFNSTPPQMYDHPLWSQSRVFSQREAILLLPRVRACDPEAVELMTTGFMRLALIIAGQYVGLFKSRRYVEDFVSAAMEGLTEGVLQLRDPHAGVDNPKSVVSSAIHRSITNAIDNMQTVRVPGGTERWKKHQGKPASFKPTRIHSDETNEEIIESGLSPDITGVEDAVDSVIETPLEADIVRLRVAGYDDNEIGEQLGFSRQTVQVIRQDLHNRLKLILPERTPSNE